MLNNKVIYSIVALIGCLILSNIILTNYNNSTIRKNQRVHEKTEQIKAYYDQIGKVVIHSLDIGLRGYALVRTERFVMPMNNALLWKDSIVMNVELPLRELNYDMTEFEVLLDSVNAYVLYCFKLRQLLDENKDEEFLALFSGDKGAGLWGQYMRCERSISAFLEMTDRQANSRYEKALSRNSLIQVLLFIVAIPTLGFLAFHTSRTYSLTQLVMVRTKDLQQANKELIEQNNQLEQYSFIVAHNLRAPLTRIVGLANVMHLSKTVPEKVEAMNKLVASTHDLDHVIKDLNIILEIKKQTSIITEINLRDSLSRSIELLTQEREEHRVEIKEDFVVEKVLAIRAYLDSIFVNLLSNAIKYRDPTRALLIKIESQLIEGAPCITIQDNGLGIDLNRFKQNIFGLYKRFHLHVEGKGMGLYLVKTQVEAMGGKIEVTSEPGKGTTFLIYLKKTA